MQSCIVKITKKGMLPIPKEIRERHGFLPDVEVTIRDENDKIVVEKMSRKEIGEEILRLLREGLEGVTPKDIEEGRKDRCF